MTASPAPRFKVRRAGIEYIADLLRQQLRRVVRPRDERTPTTAADSLRLRAAVLKRQRKAARGSQ